MSRPSTPTHPWIFVVGLASLVVGLVTAMLKTSLGASAAEATLSAGAAFAAAFGLGLGILGALRRETQPAATPSRHQANRSDARDGGE